MRAAGGRIAFDFLFTSKHLSAGSMTVGVLMVFSQSLSRVCELASSNKDPSIHPPLLISFLKSALGDVTKGTSRLLLVLTVSLFFYHFNSLLNL